MDKDKKNKIERLKDKAELFVKHNIRAIVKTYNKDFYFCDILLVGDISLMIYNFEGHRKGNKDKIFWTDIFDIDEYKERGELE